MKTPLLLSAFLLLALGESPDAQAAKPVQATAIAVPRPSTPDPSGWVSYRRARHEKVYRARGEVIVRRKPGAAQRDAKLQGAVRIRKLSGGLELLIFDEGRTDFESMRKQLAASGDALSVEPNILVQDQAAGTSQEDFARSLEYRHIQGRRFAPGKRKGKKSRTIRVGIMDTGIDFGHPDLKDGVRGGINLLYDKPPLSVPGEESSDSTEMDYHGHGTMVAGIIGARHNGFGVDGLNEDVEMVGIKVLSQDGSGPLSAVLAGVQWAIDNRIDVLAMPFGSYEHSVALEELLAQAHRKGILLVAAAGNDHSGSAMYPARYPGVVSAGSLDANGRVSEFSNWGPDVALFAPGEDLMTTHPMPSGNPYEKFSGTSAACAFVAGALSGAMQEGLSNQDARALALRTAVRSYDLHNPSEGTIRALDEENLLATHRNESLSQLTLSALTARRLAWKAGEKVSIEFRYQNTGTVSLKAGTFQARLEGAEDRYATVNGVVPALAPGEDHSGKFDIEPSRLGGIGNWTLRLVHNSDQHPQVREADKVFGFRVDTASAYRTTLLGMWIEDLSEGKRADRVMYLKIANLGNIPVPPTGITPNFQPAGHCGLDEQASQPVGAEVSMPPLLPGERRLVSLPVPDLDVPTDRDFTMLAHLQTGGKPFGRFHKQMAWRKDGSVTVQYAQVVHRWIVTEAVTLLEKQGIYIPDLMDLTRGLLHKGPTPYMNLGAGDPTGISGVINTINVSTTGYWGDDMAAQFPTDFTAVNGAHDCDETDIAFWYSSGDKWNSHFWLANSTDDDGRGSGHSALTKIRALMYGKAGVGDTKLAYGAIDHYRNGYKKPAWWFMGHVLHLIGDLSVPTHIDDNSHGLYGDAYHNWMDHGHYNEYGNAQVALNDGGYIDPYQSSAGTDPVRFLAYTTAQVGRAWPWVSTWVGPEWGVMGTRNPRGSGETYTTYMNAIYANMVAKNRTIPSMPDVHPVYTHHLDREEIKDFCAPTSTFCLCCTECQMVEVRNPVSEEYRDCWDGGDGHIDKDNTDDDGGKGYGVNTSDNDLRAIAQVNINYAIRAAAGMLVYFAKESNILSGYRTVPAINHVVLF